MTHSPSHSITGNPIKAKAKERKLKRLKKDLDSLSGADKKLLGL